MEQRENNNGNGIASIAIVPDAEPISSSAPIVSAKQEVDFNTNSGRQYALEHNQQNLGLLGKFFGASTAAPTNIAGLVVVAMVLLIAATLFVTIPDASLVRTVFVGVLSSALSFMFGASSRK